MKFARILFLKKWNMRLQVSVKNVASVAGKSSNRFLFVFIGNSIPNEWVYYSKYR